jgi:hypothetical protein
MTRFYPYPFFSDNRFAVLPLGRPLWREDESVTYSAIADWSGHWGPITIHYHLIWDCVPSSSPLTARKGCGEGILNRLHTAPSLTRGRVCNLQCSHWGPITIHYRLIWDCVRSSSPLTIRKECGGGILNRLHTAPSLTIRRVCNLQCSHWGPIAIHYRLIRDCVPSSSPLTTRRDFGGGILTSLHTGFKDWVELSWVEFILQPEVSRPVRLGNGPPCRFCPYPFFSDNCFLVLPVGRPLWREDGSVTYSAITENQ